MKNNIKKTILTLIAIITLMSTVAVLPTYAALPDTGGTVEPMWNNTLAINPSFFQYNETKGAAEIAVFTLTTSRTDICITIFERIGSSWIQIAEGSTTSYAPAATYSLMFDANSGKYYKAEFSITVTRAGISDSINKSETLLFE